MNFCDNKNIICKYGENICIGCGTIDMLMKYLLEIII